MDTHTYTHTPRQDLDKNSFESKGRNFRFIIEDIVDPGRDANENSFK